MEGRGKPGLICRRGVAAGLGLAVWPRWLRANPVSPPILTIHRADRTCVVLDDMSIASLPWRKIVTHTVWTEGPQRFRGPLLRDILTDAVGPDQALQGTRLKMTALDGYVVQVPASDAWEHAPILAREANGRMLSIRDRGPLWLVYPRDTLSFPTNRYLDERWIWQLTEIEILPATAETGLRVTP